MTPEPGASRRRHGAAILALAALAVALLPVLATPRVSDDVINYSFRWLSAGDFSRATLDEAWQWAIATGRIFVLSTVLKNVTFTVFETAWAYKTFLLVANLACAAGLFAYARRIAGSTLAAAASVLALTVLVQLRDFHDPVISFNALFQLAALLIFAALACHLRYLETGEARWAWASVAAFVANLFLYEIAVIVLPLIWLQQRMFTGGVRRAGHRVFRLLAVAFAIYGVGMIAARVAGATLFAREAPSTYAFGFDPLAIIATFAKQLLAVVPFTYFALKPRNGAWGVNAFPDSTPWLGSPEFLVGVPVFFLLAWFCIAAASRADRAVPGAPRAASGARSKWGVPAIALSLVVLPAAMISVVGRYQGTFSPGNGYSVIFFQELGAALGAGWLVAALLGRTSRPCAARALLCAALALAAGGNLVNNDAVAAKLAEKWSGQYAWGALLTSPDFQQECARLGVVITDTQPWTENRIVDHAGVRLLQVAQVDHAYEVPAWRDGEFCIARTVRVLGRAAAAYMRLTLKATREAPDSPPGVRVVFPLRDGESRSELWLGTGCPGEPRRLGVVDEWSYSGRRFALFAMQAAPGTIAWPSPGFLLPCEKRDAGRK
jgi:hypothetical protein